MKIVFGTDEALGRVIINATAQGCDGVPAVSTLWVDSRNRWIRPQQLAVAAVILFERFIGEILALEPACCPITAATIRRFLEPKAVQVISNGESPISQAEGAREALIGKVRRYRKGFLVRLATDTQVRTTVDVDEAVFACNIRAIIPPYQTDTVIELALAVIFSGNLYLDRIVADRSDFSYLSDSRLAVLIELVACAGIELRFVTEIR